MIIIGKTAVRALLGVAALALPLVGAGSARADQEMLCMTEFTKVTHSGWYVSYYGQKKEWTKDLADAHGRIWSKWEIAADQDYICGTSYGAQVCTLKARPCRPKNLLATTTSSASKPSHPFVKN
jgi:hypothetical protein